MEQMNNRSRDGIGTLRISRHVLSSIAAAAALEIPGVAKMGTAPMDLRGFFSKKGMQKPVVVSLQDDIAEIELHLIIASDAKIQPLSARVQRAVKDAVQNMTSITVSKVHIVIDGMEIAAATAV